MLTAAQTQAMQKKKAVVPPPVPPQPAYQPLVRGRDIRTDLLPPSAPPEEEKKGWLETETPDWFGAMTGGMFRPPGWSEKWSPTWGDVLTSPELQLMGAGLAGGGANWLSRIPGMSAIAGRLPGAGGAVGGAGGAVPMAGAAAKAGSGLLNWMKTHKVATGIGGAAGAGLAYGNWPRGAPEGAAPELGPYFGPGYTPTGGWPTPPVEEGLLQPGAGAYTGEPFGTPEIVDIGGQQFWWNPMGQGGIGGWELISAGAQQRGLTAEQMMAEAQKDREAAMARLLAGQQGQLSVEEQIAQMEADRRNQEQLLRAQYEAQMEQMIKQMEMERGMQSAGAAQQMSQMYAADPYKYWAQMGTPTPEAVARLTGGQIGAGEQFGQTPMSVPSAQWWGNLLPSEQQQIMGGINWLGVDPYDYLSMYQRMIPGLGSRQFEPTWAR